MHPKNISLLFIWLIVSLNLTAQESDKQIAGLLEKSWAFRNSIPDSGIFYANEAIETMRKENTFSWMAEAYNYKGLGYRTILEYDSSLQCFNEALRWATELKDREQEAYSLNNIGGIYRLKSMYFQAINFILRARDLFFDLDNDQGVAYCEVNLAVLYRYQGNYDKSSQYLRSVISYRAQHQNIQSLATAYSLLAENYHQQEKYDSALHYFVKARELYYEQSGPIEKIANTNGIAGAILEMGKIDSAMLLRTQALQMSKAINDIDQIIRSYIGLARIHLVKQQYNHALVEIDSALYLAKNKNLENRILEALKMKAEILFASGDFKEAYDHLYAYHSQYDTIFSEQKSLQIEELNSLHNSRIQEKKIASQNQKIEQQRKRNRTIALLLILAIIAIAQLTVVFRYQRKSLKLVREEKKIIEEQKQVLSQLNTTKDQFLTMIAHDLRSPFQALLGLSEILAIQSDQLSKEEIANYAEKLNHAAETAYKLQEDLLTWAKSQLGRVEKKIEKVRLLPLIQDNLLLFEGQAHQKGLLILTDIPDNLTIQTDKNILSTALRNLINNAVKFTPENGEIRITASKENQQWLIQVKDTGIGTKKEFLDQILSGETKGLKESKHRESGSGLGLMITQNFVKLLEGEISAESTPGKGSTFSIHLPVL